MSLTATDEVGEAVRVHGSVAAAARALGIPRSTLRNRLERGGENVSSHRATPASHAANGASLTQPKLTRDALNAALKPPNNCKVNQFREQLDAGSRRVLDDALAYSKADLSASRLRTVLVAAGFTDEDVPGVDAINAHRSGVRPCRCKG